MGEKRHGGGQGHSSEEPVVDIAKGCTDEAHKPGVGCQQEGHWHPRPRDGGGMRDEVMGCLLTHVQRAAVSSPACTALSVALGTQCSV